MSREDSARLFELGFEAYRTRRFSEAVELLERARFISPGEPKILSYLAESFRCMRSRGVTLFASPSRAARRAPDDIELVTNI